MSRNELDPDLQRLGDALRTSATIDLASEERTDRVEPRRAGFLRRPRVLAGGSLGLAGVGTALVLALSAGGATAPAAFAVTTNSDGSLAVNLDTDGGLVGVNKKIASMGYNEHIDFTMAQGPATQSGVINCVAQGTVSGPPVTVTVGPGDSNTETIAAGNTGAGTWHVASCTRASGAEAKPLPVTHGMIIHMNGAQPKGGRFDSQKAFAAAISSVDLNVSTDGGLPGSNQKLAGLGLDEHIEFTMAQGAASSPGLVNCTAANSSVSGPPVTVTVGSGDSNTETIAAGNTGAGTWHVASCTRYSGTDTQSPKIVK